ncbi:ataxin-7-like protein 1 isoform X2 [Antennarius striatus]|uniref:ataxin-7-like protein 1 isoform X2 n=1 Tax=Antennarius striatus TaxID=241820 RepID=UPI0035B470C1
MATLDRHIPSLDSFLCEPWSSFVSAAKFRVVDNVNSSVDKSDKQPPCLGEAAKRSRKQDMPVDTQFPAPEDLCLVVCHVCNQVVTPQGILAHYEKRHISPIPSRNPLVPVKPKVPAAVPPPAVAPNPGDTLAFRVPKDYPHSRFSKAPLAVYPPKGARNKTVSLPIVSLEKMPCLNRTDSASHVRLTPPSSSSSPSPFPLKPPSVTPPPSQRSGEKLTNGRGTSGPSTPRSTTSPSSLDGRPSPGRSPLDRRPVSTPSPSQPERKPPPSPSPSHRSSALTSSSSEKKHQNGTKASSRSQKRLSGRVFDPNKHCGVQDPETKRPCTRSLTCKTHSLTHRRAVPGRRKHFDVLLAEHKGRPKEGVKEKEKDRDGGKEGGGGGLSVTSSLETTSPSKPQCPNGRPLSTLKLRLANAHIPRVPGTTATTTPLPPAPAPAPVPNSEPLLHGWTTTTTTTTAAAAGGDGGRLSSDEGDAETPLDADRLAFPCSSHHPQPLGCCVFSSRLMGRGYYVFDRRWDGMRLALQNMVEKHLNAQMWRKLPPASESLLSLSSSGIPPVASQQTPSPSSVASSLLSSPSNPVFNAAAFPQPTSSAAPFGVRDVSRAVSPVSLVPAPGKARNGAHRVGRSSKDVEDSDAGSKKRKNSSYSAFFSSSSLFPRTLDNYKRNGSSYNLPAQGTGEAAAASPARKKGLGRGGSGLWSGREDWTSKTEGSQSHNSQNSRELGTTGLTYSPGREPPLGPHQPLAPPSGLLSYGGGGVDGRKRRSPSSYRGKASKLSRPGGLDRLFGNGSDSGGILASGPESPKQVKLHH